MGLHIFVFLTVIELFMSTITILKNVLLYSNVRGAPQSLNDMAVIGFEHQKHLKHTIFFWEIKYSLPFMQTKIISQILLLES